VYAHAFFSFVNLAAPLICPCKEGLSFGNNDTYVLPFDKLSYLFKQKACAYTSFEEKTKTHKYIIKTGWQVGKKTWKHKFIEYCSFDIKLQSFSIHMYLKCCSNIYNSFFVLIITMIHMSYHLINSLIYLNKKIL
jgi:hypothetical protein